LIIKGAASTELLEMPVTVFKEALGGNLDIRQAAVLKSIEGKSQLELLLIFFYKLKTIL